MSRMIRISDGCYVAADLIAEIKVNSSSSTITVRMKDGIGHCPTPDYKQTVYAALDALIAEVNSALSPQPADALVGALEQITRMTYDEWTNGAFAKRIAEDALAAYRAAQEKK